MKVGIFSDPHLGFDSKGERKEESFENLKQALELCIQNNVDFVLLCGDIFDIPSPSHNELYKSLECFAVAKKNNSKVNISISKKNELKNVNCEGLPVLVIHGNHEFAGKDNKTALDILSLSGLVVYFHAAKACVEKDDEKVFVHGLGAVPEKKALEALQLWNPKPELNSVNILALHQTFKEFMAISDEMVATLSLDDLPKGFDLMVNGHLHWNNEQKLGNQIFLLPGSTIATSIKKLECEKPKGVFFFETKTKELSFEALPLQRKMFYHRLKFDSASIDEVIQKCRKEIENDLNFEHKIKPLIRLNLKGTLKKGLSSGDININEISAGFLDAVIFSISKNFSNTSFKRKISELRDIQKSKLSVASRGFEILEKNLTETDFENAFDAKKIFDLLSEGKSDEVLELIQKD